MRGAAIFLGLCSAAGVVATPILAQQGDRPSRECVREIVKLCGRDRSQIPMCLTEKSSELSDGCKAELRVRAQARTAGQTSSVPATSSISYGPHERQAIDFYAANGLSNSPALVLFIHGGGWSFGNHQTTVQQKPDHFTSLEYAFASTGYRLMPDTPVEGQAADIGAAIRALRDQAPTLGFDPDQIVLIGHSAGAHLAALVSTDPQYAGDAMSAIQGVILLDGAGYDIASSMQQATPRSRQLYDRVFGDDPERQAALSPANHAGAPDAPNWLILFVEERDKARAQSNLLASRLKDAGVSSNAVSISNTDHGRMNREIGTEAGARQTQAIDAFLQQIFDN
ncbi:MAG: alpha/beta hydrolase [Pseudomonadota bacterium]